MKVYTLSLAFSYEGSNLCEVSVSQEALEEVARKEIISRSDGEYSSQETLADMGWTIERYVASENGGIVYKTQSDDHNKYDGCYYIQEWEVDNENPVHDSPATAESAEADEERRSPRLSQGS